MKSWLILILGLSLLLTGCESTEQYAARRSAKIRAVFPPGTPKEEVQQRMLPDKPYDTFSRPNTGWGSYTDIYIARKFTALENQNGKQIRTVERYQCLDGFMGMGLCYCWFYYGTDNKVVDVAWQYCSD